MLEYRKPWTRQPNKIAEPAKGVDFASSFAQQRSSWNYTGYLPKVWNHGQYVDFNGTSSFAYRDVEIALEPPFWLAVVYFRASLPPNLRFLYALGANASLGAHIGLATSGAQSGINIVYRQSSGGNIFEVGTGGTAGLTTTNELVCAVGVAPTNNSADAYVILKGQKYATVVRSATLSGTVSTANYESVGALKRNSVSDYCPFNLLAVGRGKEITQRHAEAISLDPWRHLFAPRRIWVPQAAASGLPTLGTVSATAITSSGFRPSVTYTY